MMTRRALIIFCNNTKSGQLTGPVKDNLHFRNFLMSNAGGNWRESEIKSLPNPTVNQVRQAVAAFMQGAGYTFVLFSGHGFIHEQNRHQYVELRDGNLSILDLRTTAPRQTLIIDACRGFYLPDELIEKAYGDVFESFIGGIPTREIFDKAVQQAEMGWTILFAASVNETALDTNNGGAYLLSLLEIAELWKEKDQTHHFLPLLTAHNWAKKYLNQNFETSQIPSMNTEKRLHYFPFAVQHPAFPK